MRPSTQVVGGQWQNQGEAACDSYPVKRYRHAVAVLGARGASVVLMTTPYYDSGTSPAGRRWPEDAASRVALDNSPMREVATSTPTGADGSRVCVFDLKALVSPGHACAPSVDQINVRCPDGVHLTRSGGIFVGQRLAPDLAALGLAHATASPGGEWAGSSATIDTVMVLESALPVVRRAAPDDVAAMAAQMARTFFDDPVTSHIFRNEARREAGLRAYFRTQMQSDYLPFGGCYTAEGYAGSAIWAPAGKPLHTGLSGILTMLPVLPFVAANLRTTLRLLALVESKHPHEPHWYLASLGTAVEQQGKGVGGALMRPVLEHCDAEGTPCYLESSKERNLAFYRRHGFEVVEEVPLPGDGPPIWTMWREPRPTA